MAELGGQGTNMAVKKNDKPSERNQKLQKILGLLKFVLSLDDEEITKSTIESIIELLEEEINK
jgi:hypothetical protein